MRRWEQRLARLLRALLACTVLLFAAQGSALAVQPARDVSAWLAYSVRAPAAQPGSPAPLGSPAQRRRPAPLAVVPKVQGGVWQMLQRLPRAAPAAARAAADRRYSYLRLLTLRC